MKKSKQTRKSSLEMVGYPSLKEDLKDFKKKTLELGASAVKIISADYVTLDERVWLKCLIPRCRGLANGGSPYCPPNLPPVDFIKKALKRYHWAVLFKRNIENLESYVPTSIDQVKDSHKPANTAEGYHRKTFEIVGLLESYIQSKGYYLALGLAGGSCRLQLCLGATCGVIENGTCRHPLQSRPSLEAMGIDVFGLASKVGWDTYMIRRIEPELDTIPFGISVGIVFVC